MHSHLAHGFTEHWQDSAKTILEHSCIRNVFCYTFSRRGASCQDQLEPNTEVCLQRIIPTQTQVGTLYKPQRSTKCVFCKRTLSMNKSHVNELANLDNASVVHSSSASHIKVGHHVCTNNSILSSRAAMRSGQIPELESPYHACTV